MTTATHTNNQIDIRADFAQASSLIQWRNVGDEAWRATPYQVADASHDAEKALTLVDGWLDAQS